MRASLYLPYPREEVDLDYQKLGYFQDEDGIEKVQVLLVATRREITDAYMETFQQAGLQVDVLEINSFALIRTIREHLRQFSSNEAAVIVDIELITRKLPSWWTAFPIFPHCPHRHFPVQNALSRAMNLPTSRSPEILLGMTIPIIAFDSLSTNTGTSGAPTNAGMTALMRVLGELTDELRRSINFYLNQSDDLEIVQLLLAGPGGGLAQLDEYFTQRLSVPTMAIDPIASLNLDTTQEIPNTERPGLGTVLGLGLREV